MGHPGTSRIVRRDLTVFDAIEQTLQLAVSVFKTIEKRASGFAEQSVAERFPSLLDQES